MREHVALPARSPLEPNEGKELVIDVDGEAWARIPVWTELFVRGDQLIDKVFGHLVQTVRIAIQHRYPLHDGWYLVLSEKVVAICQGRSYFLWEIKPGLAARVLCRFVRKTPYGIGLGTPWTMQLAIDEAGRFRILVAAAAGAVGKLLGRRGWFYRVAGHAVNAIDGPAAVNAYPSNVSAKLPPRDAPGVAADVRAAIAARLPSGIAAGLRGVVVIDANDLGCEVLGQDADRPGGFFRRLFRDNPLDQGRTQTPFAVCVRVPR